MNESHTTTANSLKNTLRVLILLGSMLMGARFISPMTAHAELALSIGKDAGGALLLSWPDQGTNYSYRVETSSSLIQGNWTPCAPATQWPLSITHWQDSLSAQTGPRFYRVVALSGTDALRGQLLSATLISSQNKTAIAQALSILSVPLVPQTGVSIYKLVYRTIDIHGNLTQASGALLLPDAITNALPLIGYQHGTSALKTDVPSNLNQEALIGLAFASTGYAAAMADYLGLGDSPGLHPYHHAKTEASAVVDMLRAARIFCATNGVPLNGQLFLAGYSQGGHATMAAQRELEQNESQEFPLTASAPMAGAYDLSGTMRNDFLSDRVMPNPYYVAYFVVAYKDAYAWTNTYDQVLLPKYATNLPGYFDGYHSSGQINAIVPSQPKTMFQPDFLNAIRNDPANIFRLALVDNDVYKWTPKVPTKLFHCLGDHDVLFANSQVALDYFHANGAPGVELIDPAPAADHTGGVIPCLLTAKTWFDSLKQ